MDAATVILALLAEGRTDEACRVVELGDPLYGYAHLIADKLGRLKRLDAVISERSRCAVANYRARYIYEMGS
jgi:hypothetical protein